MSKTDKIQTIVLFVLGLGLLIVLLTGQAFNHIGKPMPVDDGTLIQRMKATYSKSYHVIDGDLEQRCGELQDELAARGYETLTKDGDFWVER